MTRRLDGLFTPQKGHFSHFQPSNWLCLSLPCSFSLSCSLSRDADVQRHLRAWLLPELDCSAAQSKAASNRPRAASALSEKCLTTKASRGVGSICSWSCRRIAYVESNIVQALSCWVSSSLGEGQRQEYRAGGPECSLLIKAVSFIWVIWMIWQHPELAAVQTDRSAVCLPYVMYNYKNLHNYFKLSWLRYCAIVLQCKLAGHWRKGLIEC